MKRYIIYSFLLVFLFFSFEAKAGVTGNCDVCHTMHNSQDGASLVTVGTTATTYAGWSGDPTPVLTGGGDSSAQKRLLVSNCVGCHSSSSSNTIIDINGVKIPIVFNTNLEPSKPLAGGNFYWMVNGGGDQSELDARGHNVRGISAKDENLEGAPGTVGCTESCHVTLTLDDEDTYNDFANGCMGCHQAVNHHAPAQNDGEPPGEDHGGYRFLKGPSTHWNTGGLVLGVEDNDWEYTSSSTDHNTYHAGEGDDMTSPQGIGKFCAGCHYNYHSSGDSSDVRFFSSISIWFQGTEYTYNGGEGDDPWFRHPSEAVIPDYGEYAGSQTYSVTVPVGRPEDKDNIASVDKSRFAPGTDKVMCLSCHRAHGSPYPDMLRWNYNAMETGTTGSEAGDGCFKCHKEKDGI